MYMYIPHDIFKEKKIQLLISDVERLLRKRSYKNLLFYNFFFRQQKVIITATDFLSFNTHDANASNVLV